MKKLFYTVCVAIISCLVMPCNTFVSEATISSESNKNIYTGNGAVDTYNYTFRIFSSSDLEVVVADTDNQESTLTINTDYTVTGAGELSGGTVVLVDDDQDWIDADGDLKTGYKISIRRVRPVTQTTDIRNQGVFFPETHEDAFDHQIMVSQQLFEVQERTIKLAVTVEGVDTYLPIPAADQFLGWNSDADAIVNKTPTSLTDSGPTINSGDAYKIVHVNNAETAYELSGISVLLAQAGIVFGEGTLTLTDTLTVEGTTTLNGVLTVNDNATFNNPVTFNDTTDFNGAIDATGAGTADFTGVTISNLGTVTTADINGGTIDGVTIGASSAGQGTFTSVLLNETTAPTTAASQGGLYTKDTSGQPELFYREESSGDEVQITSGGMLASNTNFYYLYTSNDTFNVPSDVSIVFLTGCGGGGGGGGGGNAGNPEGGGGGGAGQCAIKHPWHVTPSDSISVTIGSGGSGGVSNNNGSDGGTTTFGTFSLDGGNMGETSIDNSGTGGAAIALPSRDYDGTASFGVTIGVGGNIGLDADYVVLTGAGGTSPTSASAGSGGGATPFGPGGDGSNTTGEDACATCYGSGGGGGSSPSMNGGDGAQGVLIVEYYMP